MASPTVCAPRRARTDAAVAVRGPLPGPLRLVHRRQPVAAADVKVLGDAGLLDFRLERVGFG